MSKQWSGSIAYGPNQLWDLNASGKGFCSFTLLHLSLSAPICAEVYLKMTSVKDEEEDRLNETKPVIGVDSNAAGNPLRLPILVP